MDWIISDINNWLLILCGIFYSVLCIFSIVTGLIYVSGNKELNPLELSEKFMNKFSDKEKLKSFAVKMGWVTFFVGIVQGITAFAIFRGHSVLLYFIAVGFLLMILFATWTFIDVLTSLTTFLIYSCLFIIIIHLNL